MNAASVGVASQAAQTVGGAAVNYNCVQFWDGSLGGVGNIGDDPLPVDPDGADGMLGTDDDDLHLADVSPI